MKLAYFLLASFAVLSLAGGAYGAYLNSQLLMAVGMLPGLLGILGLMAIHH